MIYVLVTRRLESSSDTESESTRSSGSSSDDDKDDYRVSSRKNGNLKNAEKKLPRNLGMSSISLEDYFCYLIIAYVVYLLLKYSI